MKLELPDLMLARHDVRLTFLFEYLRWYRDVHGPDAIEMDHFTARNYLCRSGTPLMCNVYETPGVDQVWSDPRYQQIRDRDSDRATVLAHIANKSNTSYRQVVASFRDGESDDGATHPAVQITGDCLTTLSFDIEQGAIEDLVSRYEDEVFDALLLHVGMRSARLCRRAGRLHPDTPSREPEWVLVCEWEDAFSARRADLSARFDLFRADGVPVPSSRVSADLMELVYAVPR